MDRALCTFSAYILISKPSGRRTKWVGRLAESPKQVKKGGDNAIMQRIATKTSEQLCIYSD